MEALGLNWMGRKIMGGAAIVDTAFQNMFTSAGFYGKLHAAKVSPLLLLRSPTSVIVFPRFNPATLAS